MTEQRDITHVGYTLTDGVWTGTVAQWWHLGPLLVQLVEVREVRFTDMALCRRTDGRWGTTVGSHNWFGVDWFDGSGDADADALADASRRAIAWAWKEAGL